MWNCDDNGKNSSMANGLLVHPKSGDAASPVSPAGISPICSRVKSLPHYHTRPRKSYLLKQLVDGQQPYQLQAGIDATPAA